MFINHLNIKLELILTKYMEATQLYKRMYIQYLERGDLQGCTEIAFDNLCDANITYQLLTDILKYTNGNWDY
jgi:hypothetical protein